MYVTEITSAQNPRLKGFVRLMEKSRERKETGLFLVEGFREILRCIESGYTLDSVVFNARGATEEQLTALEKRLGNSDVRYYSLKEELYSRLAYREGTENFIAIAKERKLSLTDILFKKENPFPLILVIESVEKPGNIGALLRTADACNADAVIICDPLTDLYNPNLIRASVGALFNLQVATCESREAIQWLKANGIKIFTAQLQDSQWYYNANMAQPCAIVMGSEADGLSQIWRDAADSRIKIPMLGISDSLNVSVSAAVLCYEAIRQRGL